MLRDSKAAPLPGQALVILDPARMLATHTIPREDATPKSGPCLIRCWRMPAASLGELRSIGRSETGDVFEQEATFVTPEGAKFTARRVVLRLDKPTQDGDRELAVLTHVPERDAGVVTIADLDSKALDAISPGDSGIGVRDPRGGPAAASGIARGA